MPIDGYESLTHQGKPWAAWPDYTYGFSKECTRSMGVHISNDIPMWKRMRIYRVTKGLPEGTYYGDFGNSTITGQLGTDFAEQFGRKPNLWEMIKMSKMKSNILSGEEANQTPLSPYSYGWLLKQSKNRYTNGYMRGFNNSAAGGDMNSPLNFSNMEALPVEE